MADYFNLKNDSILNPPPNTNLGNATNQFGNVYVANTLSVGNTTVTGTSIVTPKISSIGYPGDDTAANPAGGQTITLTGSGFNAGASVIINGNAVGVVSVVNSQTITFVSPAISAGGYTIYVVNSDGGTAIAIPGIQYSGVPAWSSPAAGSLGSQYEITSISQTFTASGDNPVTYSLYSGTLPPGASLNSSTGALTGTTQSTASSTTYNFTIRATDAQNQDTDRSFSLTVDPDVVTWSSPTDNQVFTGNTTSALSTVTLSATSAAGRSITYSANALPTGLSLSSNTITGNPTVVANTAVLLTATASTTNRFATKLIYFNISQGSTGYRYGIFGYGYSTSNTAITNLVGDTGTVATDTAGVGTARQWLAATGYGGDKGIFGYGQDSAIKSVTNKVSNTGVVATDTTGVGTARSQLSACTYGTDKGMFAFGSTGGDETSIYNLVSNAGVVATDQSSVASRNFAAGCGYSTDKGIFAYGRNANGLTVYNTSNLVSNAGVIASDSAGVGTTRIGTAATTYGTDKGIFAYGYKYSGANFYYSLSNLVSNTGVVATDGANVGTGRYLLAATPYGSDKGIFGYGSNASGNLSMTNKVSNTGVVATDTTGVGSSRAGLAGCGYGN